MKKFFLIAFFAISSGKMFAQNVGIGTTAPTFKLDVAGGSINTDSVYRIGGVTVLSAKINGNSYIGFHSGSSNTIGTHNTGVGYNTLLYNTSGSRNSALGFEALRSNITGTYNTSTGVYSLYTNSSGNWNVANGYQALFSNTDGHSNTAIGTAAMYANSNGTNNTALGAFSLFKNVGGIRNTATGTSSLYNNTTGSYNTANGYGALLQNLSGEYNVSVGNLSLEANSSGSGNTAIGFFSLSLTPASNYNTALGYKAGFGFNHGWNNTLLGAESNVQGAGFFNSIAIGSGAAALGSNMARIGNVSTVSIGGYTSWSNISDVRFKKNIKEDVKGLDFIMRLRPVTYQLDIFSLSKKLNEPTEFQAKSGMYEAMREKEEMVQTGFIAQEVEQAAQQTGYHFSGIDKPKNENDLYGLRYAEFVVPLVKAVQEQQALIEKLSKKVETLEGLIHLLKPKK